MSYVILTREKVLRCIETGNTHGIMNVIAKMCGVSRSSISAFFNKEENQDLRDLLEKEREAFYDDVESVIHDKILIDRETAMIIFYAKTKMKHRGYFEKLESEMTHKFAKMSKEEEEKVDQALNNLGFTFKIEQPCTTQFSPKSGN